MSNKYLKVEIADTPFLQQQGLMFRKKLSSDNGMMFKFNRPHILKFWGVNTFIPLSIAFVSPDNKIINIDRISPLSDKCVSSDSICSIAIEANVDFFEKNNIGIGSSVNIKDGYITFDEDGE